MHRVCLHPVLFKNPPQVLWQWISYGLICQEGHHQDKHSHHHDQVMYWIIWSLDISSICGAVLGSDASIESGGGSAITSTTGWEMSWARDPRTGSCGCSGPACGGTEWYSNQPNVVLIISEEIPLPKTSSSSNDELANWSVRLFCSYCPALVT